MQPFEVYVTSFGTTLYEIARENAIPLSDLRRVNPSLASLPLDEPLDVATVVQLPPTLFVRGTPVGPSFVIRESIIEMNAAHRRLQQCFSCENVSAGSTSREKQSKGTSEVASDFFAGAEKESLSFGLSSPRKNVLSAAQPWPIERRVKSKAARAVAFLVSETASQTEEICKERENQPPSGASIPPPLSSREPQLYSHVDLEPTKQFKQQLADETKMVELRSFAPDIQALFSSHPQALSLTPKRRRCALHAKARLSEHPDLKSGNVRLKTTLKEAKAALQKRRRAGGDVKWPSLGEGDDDDAMRDMGEAIVVVEVMQPHHTTTVREEWEVLASRPLSLLIDAIECQTSLVPYEPSNGAFLFLGGTFFVDDRAMEKGAEDISEVIRRADPLNVGKPPYGRCDVRKLSATLVEEVRCTLGELGVYRHIVNCDHYVRVVGVERISTWVTQRRSLKYSDFPRRRYLAPRKIFRCDVCANVPATIVTYGDVLTPHNPTAFCKVCYLAMHTGTDGEEVNDGFVKFELPEGKHF